MANDRAPMGAKVGPPSISPSVSLYIRIHICICIHIVYWIYIVSFAVFALANRFGRFSPSPCLIYLAQGARRVMRTIAGIARRDAMAPWHQPEGD